MENVKWREFTPLSLANVQIEDEFWSKRVETVVRRSIPYIYEWCVQTGRLAAFELDWQPGQPEPHIFWDSDVYKWIEAASYSLVHYSNVELKNLLDEVISKIAQAQQPDGYVNIYFTAVHPERRWTDLEGGHELYCSGHLFEAAVAHFEATGQTNLLDIATRNADHITDRFGPLQDQIRGYSGHEEIELALIKLYRTTGTKRYLELAKYFIDERGKHPNYFEMEPEHRDFPGFLDHIRAHMGNLKEYNQSHCPVRDQTEAVGHAVRGMYLYSGVADLFAEVGDSALRKTCETIWEHVTSKRMYVTGGIGSTKDNEGYTSDYDLPNDTAYAETCASVGMVMWNHRMLQIDCDEKYGDLMERALYNAVLVGISMDGTQFNYANPLESDGAHHRQAWYEVSCCPPNVARLLTSLPQYIYSTSGSDVAVHLFIQSTASVEIQGVPVTISQQTSVPWQPDVRMVVDTETSAEFGLRIRIPRWTDVVDLLVNGERIGDVEIVQGYMRVHRMWESGDRIDLHFSMPIRRNYAHPNVSACRGRVALSRGPLVYCFEYTDNGELRTLSLPRASDWSAEYHSELLGGVEVLVGEGLRYNASLENPLYQDVPLTSITVPLLAIPYCLWDNRQPGAMQLWIQEASGVMER